MEPFVYPIYAAHGSAAAQALDNLHRAGATLWSGSQSPSEGLRTSTAVLLLAGDSPGDCLTQLMAASDARKPVGAIVLSDAGARLVTTLRMWPDAFDFRMGANIVESAERLRSWLIKAGLLTLAAPAPTTPAPRRVFISYPRVDASFVARLATNLRVEGWEPFYYLGDARDYSAPDIRDEINTEIKQAAGILVLLSPEWLTSNWCRDEEYQARLLEKPRLFLRLRPHEVYYGISSRLSLDVSGTWGDWFLKVAHEIDPWAPR